MMTPTTRNSDATAVVSAATIASLGATVLAGDNMLGFTGSHFLGFGAAPFLAVFTVLVAASCVVLAWRAHDVARGIAAASVIAFTLTQSPALPTTLWFPLSMTLQVLVPLGFAACAILTWRGSAHTLPRAVSVMTAALAVAWAGGGFVPVPLEVFLALQAATLLAVTALIAMPWLRHAARLLRHLRDSATIH